MHSGILFSGFLRLYKHLISLPSLFTSHPNTRDFVLRLLDASNIHLTITIYLKNQLEFFQGFSEEIQFFAMYANIFFNKLDSALNDAHLLNRILQILENKEMTLTVFPESQGEKNCLSIEVAGTNQLQIYKDTIALVQGWARNLPIRGLPFKRNVVFS